MKKILMVLAILVLAFVAFSSCALIDERVPASPESKYSEQTWTKMERFEQNSMFGPVDRRR